MTLCQYIIFLKCVHDVSLMTCDNLALQFPVSESKKPARKGRFINQEADQPPMERVTPVVFSILKPAVFSVFSSAVFSTAFS